MTFGILKLFLVEILKIIHFSLSLVVLLKIFRFGFLTKHENYFLWYFFSKRFGQNTKSHFLN